MSVIFQGRLYNANFVPKNLYRDEWRRTDTRRVSAWRFTTLRPAYSGNGVSIGIHIEITLNYEDLQPYMFGI